MFYFNFRGLFCKSLISEIDILNKDYYYYLDSRRCLGISSFPCDPVVADDHNLEVVDSFRYLGDNISASGGCEAATITRVRAAWVKFRKILLILSCKNLPLQNGEESTTNVSGVDNAVYGSECWPLQRTDLSQLKRNERSMLRWLCHIKPENNCSLSTLSDKLGRVH